MLGYPLFVTAFNGCGSYVEESPDFDLNEAISEIADAMSALPSAGLARAKAEVSDSVAGDVDDNQHQLTPEFLTQYCITDRGYKATTPTIKTLPAGVYVCSFDQKIGAYLQPKTIVTDALVKFPDSRSEMLLAEIDRFWGLKERYASFGLSHKRGILLWGPPGSGKTSTISMAMEDMVKKGGIVLLADAPALLKVLLRETRNVESQRPITVIWEDLDAVIKRYGESEVLEILDGESQVAGVVFIATTNYPEDLDSRIVNRPSRFDRVEYIGMPNDEARAIYLTARAGSTMSPDGIDLVAATKGMSVAHLRELVVAIYCFGSDAQAVLDRLAAMEKVPSSERTPGKRSTGFGLGSR